MIKYKKLSASLFIGIIMMLSITGCTANKTSNNLTDKTQLSSETGYTAYSADINTSSEYDAEDLDSSFDKNDCTIINLSGSSTDITSAGTYLISGTLTDGCLKVNYSGESAIRLIFDGVNISCSSQAPVIIEDAKKVIITLADGSDNTITDNRSSDIDDDYSAAITSKADIIFNGSGRLNVTANHKNAIKSSDDLKIVSGNFNITSVEDGIIGKDCLCIKSGDFTINAGEDGLKSNYDKDDSKGYIIIENGTFDITSGNDGIQSEHALTIYDGTFSIKTGVGASDTVKTEKNHNMQFGRRFEENSKNNNTETTDTESIKGIKAGTSVIILSGNYTINSEDDSIHSNDTVIISGGTFNLSSGDDGIHADSLIQIDDGNITVKKSYEGIEAAVINISGGDISVSASDDGLNASGDTSGNDISINISGGKLYVNASGDGIDSNGSINISGGNTVVDGPVSSGDTALDYETSLNLTGGTVMAFGSSGMVESPTSAADGCAIVSVFTQQQASSQFQLSDSSGNIIISAVPAKTYSAAIIYSPDIKNDTQYTITAGTYSSNITTTSSITSDGTNSDRFGGFNGFNKQNGQKMQPDGNTPPDGNIQPDGQMMQPEQGMMPPEMPQNKDKSF